MINRNTLRLIVIVSCAHALVHVYELSLPSVEPQVANEYSETEADGKRITGSLSTSWRLMWGLGALLAGWLVDRYGARPMLALYLLGCAVTCGLVSLHLSLNSLFATMLAMGAFASIYHPAGLALISTETDRESLPWALGIHGIFGSIGIGCAPIVAGAMLSFEFSWQQYYACLMLPAVPLGLYFLIPTTKSQPTGTTSKAKPPPKPSNNVDWTSFGLLLTLASIQGFVYSSSLHFLARYLGDVSNPVVGSYLMGVVLISGCIGQYLAGRFGKTDLLERQLFSITLSSVPFLLWMAIASSWQRPVASAIFALIHFMHQPIYNSLVPKYTPAESRSLCYGISFVMGFGVGGLGAAYAGYVAVEQLIFLSAAIAATIGGSIGIVLWSRNRRPITV